MNPATLLNAVARKPDNAAHFILPGGEANNASDMTTVTQRAEYISKNGLLAWERLVARSATPLRADVVLHRDMDAESYKNLTLSERAEFAGRYGAEAIGAALARRKK